MSHVLGAGPSNKRIFSRSIHSMTTGCVIGSLILIVGACNPGAGTAELEVRMTGSDYRWEVRHPGPDGRLDTADDRLETTRLNVPEGTEVRVLLESRDYVYTVAVPELGLNEIAVPEMDFALLLPASRPGRFPLVGDHLCGYDHPELLGTLIVRTRDDYESWLEER